MKKLISLLLALVLSLSLFVGCTGNDAPATTVDPTGTIVETEATEESIVETIIDSTEGSVEADPVDETTAETVAPTDETITETTAPISTEATTAANG